MDKNVSPNPPTEWLKLRTRTLVLFTIESLLIGMDYSLTFLTLWLYIKTLVKPKSPTVYYSVISASFLAASLAISGIVGRLVDKSRNIRKTFFVMNNIVIIGNLVYAIPISPWTLVVGRLMAGFGGPLRSVIAGELARCYHPTSLSKVLSAMGMSYSFGFIVGPSFNFAFKDVNFFIGDWQVTFVNMPGICMALLFSCVQFLSIFLLSDISKIYDLKQELVRNDIEGRFSALNEEAFMRKDIVANKHTDLDTDRTQSESPHCTVITQSKGVVDYGEESMHPQERIQLDGLPLSHFLSMDDGITTSAFDNKQCNNILSKCTEHRKQLCKNKNNYGCGAIENERYSTECVLVREESSRTHLAKCDENEPLISPRNIPSTFSTLKKLISHIDTTLLLCLAFFESYFAVSFDMWYPMLVIDTMGWSVASLNWIVIGFGVACVVPCIILIFVNISDRHMYIWAMGCLLSLSVMETIFIVLSDYNSNKIFDYIAWTIYSLLYAFLVVMEEVFLVGCLAKMVNSNIQTFADSIRLTMYRLGALIALMTSALIFQWIEVVGCVHITIILAGFTLMIMRRESFMNPKIII